MIVTRPFASRVKTIAASTDDLAQHTFIIEKDGYFTGYIQNRDPTNAIDATFGAEATQSPWIIPAGASLRLKNQRVESFEVQLDSSNKSATSVKYVIQGKVHIPTNPTEVMILEADSEIELQLSGSTSGGGGASASNVAVYSTDFLVGAYLSSVLGTANGKAVLAEQPLSFDGTNYHRPFIPGTGTIKTITIAVPAAGANFTQTVPAGKMWRIKSLVAKLVCAAVAANRYTGIKITDGTNEVYNLPTGPAITSGQTAQQGWMVGLPVMASTTFNFLSNAMHMPDIVLGAGYVVSDDTALQAADQWSNIFLVVEEFTL